MGNNNAEILAQIAAGRARLTTSIREGEELLERNAIVGAGYVCVLADFSMGLTRDGEVFRLHPMTGGLAGIIHRDQVGAEGLAATWNRGCAAKGEEYRHCTVRAVHFRVAVEGLLALQRGTLDTLDEAEARIIRENRPTFTKGQRVHCNGYEGTVYKVCDGQLAGMYEVRLPGGLVCVSACDIAAL
jgi:hypothetical protein